MIIIIILWVKVIFCHDSQIFHRKNWLFVSNLYYGEKWHDAKIVSYDEK